MTAPIESRHRDEARRLRRDASWNLDTDDEEVLAQAIADAERRGALQVLDRLGPIVQDAEVARDELCQEFQP